MSGPRRSHPALALALVALIGAAACNDGGTGVGSDPITGTWVAEVQGGTLFLEISAEQVAYYQAADGEDCAERTVYDAEDLGGGDYRLTSTVTPISLEVRITANGDELRWQTDFGTAIFYRTGTDLSTLTICAGGGDDPTLTCTDLPPVATGQDVAGSLAQTDAEERGRYYDVYAFEPQAQDTVTVTAASSEFDAYLYVYDAAGELLAENDDAAEGSTDAGLSLQVVPGCYRVEVTSLGSGATGAYTLRID